MEKPISRQAHGAIDYAYAALVPFIPELAGFTKEEKANLLCKALGGGALAYTAITKAEWGLCKILPFKAHLLIDLSVSIFAAASPWVLGFADNKRARNAAFAIGLAGISASLLTDDKELPVR
ncbi:hypothetical protein ACFQZX_14495 [Mucilaginibacter litoreus]|uniref:Uncharacterized protein n=1 Tax=Mucilaginibacter litoreus TaxID=1048221 RepID=A0ABW3AVL8_9SPHI